MTERPISVIGRDPVPAPWTPEQVAAIERWQACEIVHALTCQYHGAQVLDVTPGALYCARDGCDYRQTWIPAAVLTTLRHRSITEGYDDR